MSHWQSQPNFRYIRKKLKHNKKCVITIKLVYNDQPKKWTCNAVADLWSFNLQFQVNANICLFTYIL